MIYSDFTFFSAPTSSSLGLGYTYFPLEYKFLIASGSKGEIRNFPFGKSPKDTVEFYVYTLDGDIITSSYIEPEDRLADPDDYTDHTHSYTDVTNRSITYSYTSYESDFSVVGTETKSLVLDISRTLNNLGVREGTYKLGILPVRNVVGKALNDTQRLVIDEISPSRFEVAVIPHSKKNTTDSAEQELNDEFEMFAYSRIKPKLIIDNLMEQIKTPEFYRIYNAVAKANPDADSLVKHYYAFKTSADLVSFITDIYYGVNKGSLKNNGQLSSGTIFGIFDQLKNFLYQNYDNITTFQEIRNYYYSLFLYILDSELNQITNKKPAEYNTIVAFFRQIFYDVAFYPAITSTENDYQIYFSGYLKNSMNFGGGRLLPILNYQVSPSNDPIVSDRLILKLLEALPSDIKVGDAFWVSCTTVSTPVVQSTYFYSNSEIPTYQLRGPNFNFKMENEGSGTENLSIDTITGASGSLSDEITAKLKYKTEIEAPLNTDYRYFENFIRFSCVTSRLDVYSQKISRIDTIRSEIATLDSKLSLNGSDEFYLKEKRDLEIERSEIETSFDGYETFLTANPDWYSEHTNVYDGVTSSSLFDEDNRGSLQNNLPEFISGQPANEEYVTFVNMIGHYFDNLMLYIDQFTEKNNASNSETEGISKDVVYDMLTSLGWEPEMGRENLPLLLSAFSKDDFDVDTELWNKVGTMSEDDRNKFIWKRILNNLPFILKAKGTEAAINALISCYGIPRNLIQIREYGGIDYTTETNNESRFIFDETKYSPYFSGSNEYFKLNWSGSVQSAEFNFTFDTDKVNEEGKIFRLMTAEDKFVVGIVREKGNDWGRAFFSISGSGVITTSTSRAPLFDGNPYSLLLRRQPLSSDFNLSASLSSSITDAYPQKYELIVKRNEDSRTTFQVQASVFLSGSYNASFRDATYVYYGNYQQSTASFGVDPEAFFGTLDEIRLWETPLTDARFDSHASYRGSYDLADPRSVVSELLSRVSFSTPVDLYSATATTDVTNAAFKKVFPIVWAVNFPETYEAISDSSDCNTYSHLPRYPYQFQKIEMIQTVNLPNFGSNKFKSNKIKFKEQQLISNLSPDSRSTNKSSQDSDIDSNKLGIFFSPSSLINNEIMKFFGNFQLGDLIGKPNDVYEKTYKRFNRFREVFYDQGGGQIDYQTFMNLVRAYFDKSIFKYIKNLVPVRAKLVEGLLIEPTILERPKLQLKPLQQEIHNNLAALLTPTNKNLNSTYIPALTQSLQINTIGRACNDDVNRLFYSDRHEPDSFSVYAEDGIAFYKDDFYRTEVLNMTASVIEYDKSRVPLNCATSSYDVVALSENDRGKFVITKKYWKQLNISRFPVLPNIPINNSMTLVSIDQTHPSQATTLAVFTGSLSGPDFTTSDVFSSVTKYAPITIDGTFVSSNIVSGSGESGSVAYPIGITGTLTAGSVFVTGTYNHTNKTFSGTILLSSVGTTFVGSLYSLKSGVSAVNYFINKTSGGLFDSLSRSEYAVRKNLSMLNVPYNSTPLNGYYHTHFKYKKSIFSKKVLKLLDSDENVVGTFKRGSQTQKTTVQAENGLQDNSLPVVITKTS